MDQPFILCGLGRVGWRVLEYLQAAGFAVVVVDTKCSATDSRLRGVRLVTGDCRMREILEQAGVAGARGVLIMTNDDLVNISTALLVRHLAPDVRIVMRMFHQNLIARLGKAVHNVFALSTASLTAPLFALSALTGQALGTIRLEGKAGGRRQVAEVVVGSGTPFDGRPVAALARKHRVQVVAHVNGHDRFLLDVDPEARLKAGDRLVVCGDPRDLAPLLGSGEDLLPHVRWANVVRRLGRMVWRTLAEVDLAVKICGATFVLVLVASTLTLHFGIPSYKQRLGHSLFRAVSIMATGADMHGEEFDAEWQKVFASTLRITGALLTAAFTAIVTNYLLRARLGGALEMRRIPDSGHVVICGLGNIGFCVVEELLRYGERVVVIEQARDSRFVTTARRLGVPVLIGDATVAEVLRQAHVAQARAVVAATSDDLVNFEVALMVRELNPAQRVVVHLSDPTLAQTARDAANVRLALSIPTLAAPAFVAGLFGDRVQTVLMVDGRLLAVVDLVVQPGDGRLAGRTAREVSQANRWLPLAVVGADGVVQDQPLEVRLEPGSRLVAISDLPDLQRWLQRDHK